MFVPLLIFLLLARLNRGLSTKLYHYGNLAVDMFSHTRDLMASSPDIRYLTIVGSRFDLCVIIVPSHICTWISELMLALRSPPNTQLGGMLDKGNLDQYPPRLPPVGRRVSPSV